MRKTVYNWKSSRLWVSSLNPCWMCFLNHLTVVVIALVFQILFWKMREQQHVREQRWWRESVLLSKVGKVTVFDRETHSRMCRCFFCGLPLLTVYKLQLIFTPHPCRKTVGVVVNPLCHEVLLKEHNDKLCDDHILVRSLVAGDFEVVLRSHVTSLKSFVPSTGDGDTTELNRMYACFSKIWHGAVKMFVRF